MFYDIIIVEVSIYYKRHVLFRFSQDTNAFYFGKSTLNSSRSDQHSASYSVERENIYSPLGLICLPLKHGTPGLPFFFICALYCICDTFGENNIIDCLSKRTSFESLVTCHIIT